MRVYKSVSEIPSLNNVVLTIGNFDGLHLGHQRIIQLVKEKAAEIKGESVLLSFHPHPRLILKPDDSSLRMLNTMDEKVRLLDSYGLKHLALLPFSVEFSQIPAIQYVKDFLCHFFNPKFIVIGYDHHFGKDRLGGIDLLKKYQTVFGYKVIEIDKQTLDNITLSSTQIRGHLLAGNISSANKALGHEYSLEGVVVKGEQIGKTLGFPTANIQLDSKHKLVPKNGVYLVKINRKLRQKYALLNIGTRPTFEGRKKTIEAFIIDFQENIYGERLKVDFISRLRDERKFSNKEALIQAMQNDLSIAMSFINSL